MQACHGLNIDGMLAEHRLNIALTLLERCLNTAWAFFEHDFFPIAIFLKIVFHFDRIYSP